MMYYRNGRFYLGNLSFALPDDIALDTCQGADYEDTFEIHSTDEALCVHLYAEYSDVSPKEFFEGDSLEPDTFQRLSGIQPILCGGLYGYFLPYTTGERNYCEYRFRLIDEASGNNTFCIVTRSECLEYTEILAHRVVQELLESIQREA